MNLEKVCLLVENTYLLLLQFKKQRLSNLTMEFGEMLNMDYA